jgi:hypothetical protein
MVLEVGVVVCAIAGVAIIAAMTIAPYRCDLMFQLRFAHLEKLGNATLVSTANETGRETPSALSSVGTG